MDEFEGVDYVVSRLNGKRYKRITHSHVKLYGLKDLDEYHTKFPDAQLYVIKKYLCACGCGGYIIIKPHHRYIGLPKFIHGHNRKKPDVTKLCEVCGDEFTVEGNSGQVDKKTCSKDCQYILMGDKNSGKHEGKWHTCICHQCGNSFERYNHRVSEKEFCCIECLNLWRKTDENKIYLSIINQGIKPEDWDGFITWHRDHIIDKRNCIQLNSKFNNSDAHHLTRSIIIFIPSKLHQHIKHNLKTGSGMAEMNILSLQYLNGYYDG